MILSSDVMALYLFFLSSEALSFFALDWNIVFFLLPLPAHYVAQPRGKSSQAHPGPPESGPRHRYLSPGL